MTTDNNEDRTQKHPAVDTSKIVFINGFGTCVTGVTPGTSQTVRRGIRARRKSAKTDTPQKQT